MPLESDIYYYSFSSTSTGIHPPIVLIHGAGGNHLFWPPGIRRLPGYNTISLDLPGHGKSPGRGRQSIDAYTADILKWIEEIELNRAVFIGHSMGSAIAISRAPNHTGRCEKTIRATATPNRTNPTRRFHTGTRLKTNHQMTKRHVDTSGTPPSAMPFSMLFVAPKNRKPTAAAR